MKYKVISRYDINALVDEVNILMKKGWKPQGGICAAVNNHNLSLFETTYYQAMVIDKEKS